MPSISSVYSQLTKDFPRLLFKAGDTFQWSPTAKTITHPAINTVEDIYQLLHEISHAELNHNTYKRDIELITMEREAWQYASQHLAPRYNLNLPVDDDIVQDNLDSYRQWLHDRSTCPTCLAVGHEVDPGEYSCLNCHQLWKVNEARTCRLKRTKL
ncbi:hypothetical protein B7Y94_04325 [Candidatus Saccharibacteria bacterium 32-49-12]|nr:MAG: hypothetical protein B7Y94_04325 [Candidatus Saccharibacteria bacterium 32-49-12]